MIKQEAGDNKDMSALEIPRRVSETGKHEHHHSWGAVYERDGKRYRTCSICGTEQQVS